LKLSTLALHTSIYGYVGKHGLAHAEQGLPAALLVDIGEEHDWITMSSSTGILPSHPVEQFASFLAGDSREIVSDPTEILKARALLDQDKDEVWVSRSESKVGVYHPISSDESATLL
jgi:hypothetical protein